MEWSPHSSFLTSLAILLLLLEEEEVDVDDVVQDCGGTQETPVQSSSYPTAEHILPWKRYIHTNHIR
jgi:hypothetical protein